MTFQRPAVHAAAAPLGCAGARAHASRQAHSSTAWTRSATCCSAAMRRRGPASPHARCACRSRRREEGDLRLRAEAALQRVGYAGAADARMADLSTWQRRQIEIARALLSRPKLLLLDEPAAGLSAGEVEQLKRLLLELRDSGGGEHVDPSDRAQRAAGVHAVRRRYRDGAGPRHRPRAAATRCAATRRLSVRTLATGGRRGLRRTDRATW